MVEQYPVGLPGLEGLDLGVTGDLQVYGILQSGDLGAGVLQQQGGVRVARSLDTASWAASSSCHWPTSHVSKADSGAVRVQSAGNAPNSKQVCGLPVAVW